MEEYVQLSLNTYDSMRETINRYLKENATLRQYLKDETEEKERIINKAETIIKNCHDYVLSGNLQTWKFGDYPYDDIVDFDDKWGFAMDNKTELLELGITKEKMIDYIMQAFAKWEKEKEDE